MNCAKQDTQAYSRGYESSEKKPVFNFNIVNRSKRRFKKRVQKASEIDKRHPNFRIIQRNVIYILGIKPQIAKKKVRDPNIPSPNSSLGPQEQEILWTVRKNQENVFVQKGILPETHEGLLLQRLYHFRGRVLHESGYSGFEQLYVRR